MMSTLRIGNGFDIHPFIKEKKLILGGVDIPHPLGLKGHSDADVLIHALLDALLGALAIGDIGQFFPDTDPQYKNANSLNLLKIIAEKYIFNQANIINIDATVICEQPKISPFIKEMKKNISECLNHLDLNKISIKGKTSEKIGCLGREEGIAVYVVALLQKK